MSRAHHAAPDRHLDRRAFLAGTAALGATAALPSQLAAQPDTPHGGAPRAEAVIQIYLGGGLSHIDSFDPKPDMPVDTRGPFRSIATKLEDVRFSELCRCLLYTSDAADE